MNTALISSLLEMKTFFTHSHTLIRETLKSSWFEAVSFISALWLQLYWLEDADPPNIALRSESSHYLFMLFTHILNHNTCIPILICLPPVVPNGSEADLSNYSTSLNIKLQYCATSLQDTNQFTANSGLKEQSPCLFVSLFYTDIIYSQYL